MVKVFKEVNKITLVFTDTPSSTQDFLIDLIKTSYSDGVRIKKEFQKITITFYDGSDGTDSFVKNLISMGYGGSDVYEINVEGLIPLTDVKLTKGIEITGTSKKFDSSVVLPEIFKFSGLTIEQALTQHGDEALLDMCLINLDSKDKSLLLTIRTACKNYVLKKYVLSDEDVYATPTSVMIDFIQNFKILLLPKVNDILSRSSYATIEDFIENADGLLLGSAYKALAKELVNKFK